MDIPFPSNPSKVVYGREHVDKCNNVIEDILFIT